MQLFKGTSRFEGLTRSEVHCGFLDSSSILQSFPVNGGPFKAATKHNFHALRRFFAEAGSHSRELVFVPASIAIGSAAARPKDRSATIRRLSRGPFQQTPLAGSQPFCLTLYGPLRRRRSTPRTNSADFIATRPQETRRPTDCRTSTASKSQS